jgi:hypothetical protein
MSRFRGQGFIVAETLALALCRARNKIKNIISRRASSHPRAVLFLLALFP